MATGVEEEPMGGAAREGATAAVNQKITPLDRDVLFGKGIAINNHPGTRLLRTIVREEKPKFLLSRREEKRDFACRIVDGIHKLGGRFLVEDPDDKDSKKKNATTMMPSSSSSRDLSARGILRLAWIRVGDDVAIANVMHRLREKRSAKKGDFDPTETDLRLLAAYRRCCLQQQQQQQGTTTSPADPSGRPATSITTTTEIVPPHDDSPPEKSSNGVVVEASSSLSGSCFFHYFPEMVAGEKKRIMKKELFPMSIVDFIRAGHLWDSMTVARCEEGDKARSTAPARRVDDNNAMQHRRPRIMLENAARLSLVLARLIAEHSAAIDLEFVRLDDFFLDVVGEEGNDDERQAEEEEGSGSMVSPPPSGRRPRLSIRLHLDTNPRTRFDGGGPNDHKNGFEATTTTTTTTITAMQVLGRHLYYIFAFGESPPSDLIDGGFSSSSSHRKEEEGEATTSRRRASSSEEDDGDDIIELLAKSFRRTSDNKSIYSRLIESNKFPSSVCRFLSDLLSSSSRGAAGGPAAAVGDNKAGGGGGSDTTPFGSLDEVARDLEQMVLDPEIFLHDSGLVVGDPQRQPAIVFGQRIYGRGEEIAKLSAVARRMMQEAATLQQQQPNHHGPSSTSSSGRLDALFVSGIAGSGKSRLVKEYSETLSSSSGWIVVNAKFERGLEHASRGIISSMFDGVVKYLVGMKESRNASDVRFSLRASKAIMDAIGHEKLPSLVNFLPTLPLLLGGSSTTLQLDGTSSSTAKVETQEGDNWQLIHSLTKILESVLESDRFIMICCDDLQWGDRTTLSIISEVLVNISSLKRIRRHCFFVGLFRHDEINDNHPFSTQYSYLQTMAHNINMTNIKLDGLSKEDMVGMLKAELRLPHRLVVQLAHVVHKKTSGHTLFVSELLNSLLRDSIIAYSPQYRRYSWDHDIIEMIPTGEGVAGLIASNVKSLPQASQRVLQILSCFGIQTDMSLLQILERFEGGIIASLDTFIEKGILDRAGPIIMFSHDLIQQEVYVSLPPSKRHRLHLEIGQFLGALANVDRSKWIDPMSTGIDLLQIDGDREFFGGYGMMSSLISLACDNINSAGTAITIGDGQRFKFAEWNQTAGEWAYRRHDFRASLYYFSNGITLLGHGRWHKEHERLCLDLYDGKVHSHASLGESDDAVRCAEIMVENAPFEDALEAQRVILRSYHHLGKHKECISRGVNILNRLNCDIPSNPTPGSVALAMAVTDSLAANFSKDQIVNLCEEAVVDNAAIHTIKILDAMYNSGFVSSSPLLPLMACRTIQFSLQHRGSICLESTAAFGAYSIMKIGMGDFKGGRWWADVAREVEQKLRHTKNSNITAVTLLSYGLSYGIDIWWRPLRQTSKDLFKHYQNCMRTGQTDIGVTCMQTGFRHSLFGGESCLTIMQKSYEDKVQLAAKHSKFMAMLMALDGVLLTELTGKPGEYFSAFGDFICNVSELQAWAESSDTGNVRHQLLCHHFVVAFWKGDYVSAESHLHKSLMLPASRMPSVILIYETFFGGIVALQLFRQAGGDQRLRQGKQMLDRMDKWAQISMDVFENKWHLLKAEYSASIGQHAVAEQLYKASIKSARSCGNIHELALANELLASHYSKCGCRTTLFNQALKESYVYYTQWGASAVTERLQHKHDEDVTAIIIDAKRMGVLKRSR